MTMPTKFERNWDRGKKPRKGSQALCSKYQRDLVHVRHCNQDRSGANSVNPICPIDNACNAWVENVQDLYYDRS